MAQIILLFMVTTPTYVLLLASKISPLTTSDRVIAGTLLCVIVVEWFADQQQWGKLAFAYKLLVISANLLLRIH